MQNRRIKINWLVIPLLLAAFFGHYLTMFGIAYITALLHEGAHILTAKLCGVKIARLEIQPFGVCGVLESHLIKNPAYEILIALAGPMLNLLFFSILFFLDKYGISYPYMPYAASVNLAMLLLNLLPTLPLDGGRILKALLTLKLGGLKAYLTMVKLSRICIAVLLAAAIALLVTAKFNFSLILIAAFLLGNLGNEQKNISLMAMKEILYHKEKLRRDDVNRITFIAVYADMPAGKVLHTFTYHKYYMIQVLDHDERLIKTLTEGQVLRALIEKSVRTPIGEI